MVWIFVVLGLCVFLAVGVVLDARRRRAFDERWPPISDDEFVARCSPGADRAVALEVRRMIAEQFSVPYEQVHPGQEFVGDLEG